MGKDKMIDIQDDMLKALDIIYEKTKEGIGKASPPISKMADDYLKKTRFLMMLKLKKLQIEHIRCL